MRKKKHCHVKVSFTQVSLGLQAHLFLNTDFLEHEKQAENVQECHRNAAIMKERTFCELSLKHHQRVECRVDSSLILTMQCHILKLPQSSDKSQLFNYKRLTCCSYTKKKNKKKTCMFGTLRSLQPRVSSSPDVRLTDFK